MGPAKDKVDIWLEGVCPVNPGIGGYSVLLLNAGRRREMVGGYALTTNNRIILIAAIVALESLEMRRKVIIYSDSRYLVDGMKSASIKRRLAKEQKQKLINADLWGRLFLAREKHMVRFKWVKHASTPEHEMCTKLAETATLKSNLPEDSGYKVYRKPHGLAKKMDGPINPELKEKLDNIDVALEQGQRVDKKEFRTHLKHSHTEAELLLWKYLNNGRKGQRKLHFQQQFPIGPYFADFCHRKAKIVVEIDGRYHEGQIEYDKRRDDFMTSRGFLVLRYKNEEVLSDVHAVLTKIYSTAIERRNVAIHTAGLK